MVLVVVRVGSMRRAYWETCTTDHETENTLWSNLSWVLAQLSLVTVIFVLLGVTYIRDPLVFLLYICLFYVPIIVVLTYALHRRTAFTHSAPPKDEFV